MQFSSMRRALAATVAAATLALVASGCSIGNTHTTDFPDAGVEYDNGATNQLAIQLQGTKGPVWMTPTGWGNGRYQLVVGDPSLPDVVDATVTTTCRGAIALTAPITTPHPYQLAPTTRPGPAWIDGTPVTLRPDGPGQMSIANPGALTNDIGAAVTTATGADTIEGMYAGNGAVITVGPLHGAADDDCH